MWVAAALALGPAVSNGIGRFAYALVLPAMRSDLHWTYTEAGWVNTANALGYLAGALATLRLLRGVRLQGLFAAAMVVTTAAIFASGLSRSYPLLLSLRFVAGLSVDALGTLTVDHSTINKGAVTVALNGTDVGTLNLIGTAVLSNGTLTNDGTIDASGAANKLDTESVRISFAKPTPFWADAFDAPCSPRSWGISFSPSDRSST